MKYILTCLIACLSVSTSMAQKTNPNYDSALATKLGEDDYGMKV